MSPITNKPEAVRFWAVSLLRLELPDNIRVVWLDMTTGEVKRYLNRIADEVRKRHPFIRIDMPEKENIPNAVSLGENESDFLRRRKAIADSMDILASRRMEDEDMLLYEDDIVVPPDAFTKLYEVFCYSDDFYGVTCTQYPRTKSMAGRLLHWDWEIKKTFGDGDTSQEVSWSLRGLKECDEQKTGIRFVGASASGFTLYRKEFLNQHSFVSDGSRGQDIICGKHIAELGKKLVLVWDVKAAHIGKLNGKFHIFRSQLCDTEVVDELGVNY